MQFLPLMASSCGFAASVASFVRRRRRPVMRRAVATLPVPTQMSKVEIDVDDVEQAIGRFVPEISKLKRQAEILRNGELQNVLQTLQDLDKTELTGVFSEVDELLSALVETITGLQTNAQTIRRTELRQKFGQSFQTRFQASNATKGAAKGNVDSMTEVHVVGLSHHSAPVEIRERLAVAERDWNRYAREIVEFTTTSNGPLVPEAAVLSTCNRFEIILSSSELKAYGTLESVHSFLCHKSGLSREELDPYLFTHSGERAIHHLFKVSSGLDSLVLGEAQILAQVKACHKHCTTVPSEDDAIGGSGGKIVAKMLNRAVRIGRLARTKTRIGKGAVSVSSAAVELMVAKAMGVVRKHPHNLKVCIMGAGKMARLLMIALYSKYPDIQLTLVNRSLDKARALFDEVSARGGSRTTIESMAKMQEVVDGSDVVFVATASEEPIIKLSHVEKRDLNLMLVDICVPRNVAEDVATVNGVSSYSVDDLKKIQEANNLARQDEVVKAEKLIASEVANFKTWQASQGAVPYLASLQAKAEEIRENTRNKMSRQLKDLDDHEHDAVDKLTRQMFEQLFRPLYYSMKVDENMEDKRSKIQALKDMFQLEPVHKRKTA